ncbi:flagellar biosynthetic protein FliO [Arthrobacter sp. LAPM80]|uniref:flagellar biosynthetic protein FliO n=1 Tax=Arthrobacter sp. LAPM80 TaxID=3141788 RepID=UPI00398B4905
MDAFLLVLRVGLSLGVVMVLLWMAQKRFSKAGRPGEQAVVEVVGRRSVGPKASVVVVEAEGLRFLLGVTENSISVLHSAEASPAYAGTDNGVYPADDPAFAEVLKAAGEPALRKDVAAARRLRNASDTGSLHGSIFAASTWAQAGAAVRKGLNL